MRKVKNGSSGLAGRNERSDAGAVLTRFTLVALRDFAGARLTVGLFAAALALLAGFLAAGM